MKEHTMSRKTFLKMVRLIDKAPMAAKREMLLHCLHIIPEEEKQKVMKKYDITEKLAEEYELIEELHTSQGYGVVEE